MNNNQISNLKRVLPSLIGVTVFVVAIYILHHSLHAIHFRDVVVHLKSIPILHILLALVCMVCSYTLLTCYDYLALIYVDGSLPWKRIAPTSFSAFAIGHNLGFAALSGGAIRYRAYTAAGLTAIQITNIIIFVTSSFATGASLLLGISLLVEPASFLHPLHVPLNILRAIGVVFVLLPIAYLIWTYFPTFAIKFRDWRFGPPTLRIAFGQIVLSTLDLLLASVLIFILMPSDMGIGYISFLGIYLLAMSAGVLSGVPGGLGVFEGALFILLPNVPAPALLGALLVYRVIYYLIPLIFALLVLAWQELRMHREKLLVVAAQSSLILTKAAPQMFSAATFIAGAILLFSGNLPSVAARLDFLSQFLPNGLMEASHMLSSTTGVVLLILARGLYRRLHGAYWLTLWMLGLGIIVSLTKGFDYEEAILLSLLALLLWTGRKEFYRKASLLDEPFSQGWMMSIILIAGSAIWLGFFIYRHVDYNDSLWWKFAINADAPRVLRASLIVVVLVAGFGLMRLMRLPSVKQLLPTPEDLAKAQRIIAKSTKADSNVALMGDKLFLFHQDNDAFIMYQISGRSGIALGDPVGNPAHFEPLIWNYRELCDQHDIRCVFYQVSDDYLPLYIDLGLTLSKLGENAKISLRDFSLEGSKRAELRQVRNRATREQATFEIIPSASVANIMPELKTISDAWLSDKAASEKGFSLGAFDEQYLLNFDIAVVRVKGSIVAFANIFKSGGYDELSVDLMRHSKTSPKGVMDYLFVEIILWGKNEGYKSFSLGMAPLSGLERHPLAPLWHKIGNIIFRFGDEFYNFDGLRSYKQKFFPDWEPRYLAAPGGLALPRIFIDATTLISGGVKEIFIK
jgi:phosphatidylglycerol lysyltransferase